MIWKGYPKEDTPWVSRRDVTPGIIKVLYVYARMKMDELLCLQRRCLPSEDGGSNGLPYFPHPRHGLHGPGPPSLPLGY